MTIRYLEWAAPDSLKHLVQCAWRLSDEAPEGTVQTIYPDGRCEVIVHLRRPMQREDAQGAWRAQSPALFAAQQRVALRLRAAAPFDCVGVRLRPEASSWLAGSKLPGWRDAVFDLDDLGRDLSRSLREAVSAIGRLAQPESLWAWVERAGAGYRPPSDIARAVLDIDAAHGLTSARALSQQLGCPLRTVQQRFLHSVGLSVREYANVIRLQATIRMLDEPSAGLARIADERGFSDQPHATRALRGFTGLTPARLAAGLRDARGAQGTIQMAAAFVRGKAGVDESSIA